MNSTINQDAFQSITSRFVVILSTFVLVLTLILAPVRADDQLPSRTYKNNRESTSWIAVGKVKVAVDEGISWNDHDYYLSLTGNLICAKAMGEKAKWSHNVGIFWNKIQIEKIKNADNKELVVVAIRGKSTGKEFAQYYDPLTGKQIVVADKKSLGKKIAVKTDWSGDFFGSDKPIKKNFTTLMGWQEACGEFLKGRKIPKSLTDVDFKKDSIVLLSPGKSWNTSGWKVVSAFEDDDRILIRTVFQSYQTLGGADRTYPFCAFRVSNPAGKPIVIQRDVQGLIGGPEVWKIIEVFKTKGDK